MRTTNITVEIELDENHVPEKMTWNAPDGWIKSRKKQKQLWLPFGMIKQKRLCASICGQKEMTR